MALLLMVGPGMGLAESPISLEYKVKGAVLLNFAKFVKWPAEAFASTNTPVTIGIVGENPFGDFLNQLVAGETIGSRPIVVKRLGATDDLSPCQVLFIPESTPAADVLKRAGPGVLTVGESDDFMEDGGTIHLLIQDNKVRFEVNMEAAERAHLTISSQLLKLAKSIKPSGHGAIVPKSSH